MIGHPNRPSGLQIPPENTYTSPSQEVVMDSPTYMDSAQHEAT